jgi:hypothetical protein
MNRTIRLALLGGCLALCPSGCGRPAQIGPDAATFKAVDALYTAVSLRDPGLVARCDAELKALRAADKLPDAAAKSLDAIIAEAGQGRWEPAIDRLGRFMEGQRR